MDAGVAWHDDSDGNLEIAEILNPMIGNAWIVNKILREFMMKCENGA